MAKITAYVPEPTQNYDVNNQRQILEAINTIKDQLNFGYQQDLVNQQNCYDTVYIWNTIWIFLSTTAY
jgi:ABC-type dipeptide/oligopeptide/nickel transport system ATPase component